jgi:hypothetical protein
MQVTFTIHHFSKAETFLGVIWGERWLHGFSGGYTLVMLPRNVTPYRDSVDESRDHVTYQKLVTL